MARQDSAFSSLLRLLCLVLVLSPALAAASAGQLIFARGQVSILGTDGQSRAGQVGATLNEGDHVTTGGDSMVQIRLSDGALVSLRSHSDYQIQVQKDEGLLEQAGKLFSGWMRAVSGAIGKSEPDSVSWSTPVATIGIRGTTFQVIHIPEGGLPGYDDTPPGTYIYLEEGGIETTSEGGTRFIRPGQVVWVSDRGGRPRLAPERRRLFLAGLGGRVGEQDRQRVRLWLRRLDEEQRRDRIADALVSGFLLDGLRPAALGIYGNGWFRSISPNVKTLGTGSDTVVTGMLMPGDPASGGDQPERRIFVSNTAASPLYRGGTTFGTGNSISWGAWSNGDYTYQEDIYDGNGPTAITVNGDWHYIWTNRALFDVVDVASLGLRGSFTYDYVGGTTLTENLGGGTTMDVVDGRLVVDFGKMGIFADLDTTDGGSAFHYVGSGSFGEFYSGVGITLDDTTGNAFGNGYMQGMFTGSSAEGAAAILDLAGASTGTYTGVAAFRRTGGYDYSRVYALGAFGDSVSGPMRTGRFSSQLQWDKLGDSRVLTAQLDPGLTAPASDYLLRAIDGSVPFNTGFHLLADDTEINWGVWDPTSYTATEIQSDGSRVDVSGAGDWHYMMANNVIAGEAGLLNTGLTGTYTYNYVGGTGLTNPNGQPAYTVSSGSIDVLFGSTTVDMQVTGLSLSGPSPTNLTSGVTSASNFYQTGITLSDINDPNVSGSIRGVFVGSAAEGIISNIKLNDGAAYEYTGTAAFER